MDKSLWVLVSFAVGFVVLAMLVSLVVDLPSISTGFFENTKDQVFQEWL